MFVCFLPFCPVIQRKLAFFVGLERLPNVVGVFSLLKIPEVKECLPQLLGQWSEFCAHLVASRMPCADSLMPQSLDSSDKGNGMPLILCTFGDVSGVNALWETQLPLSRSRVAWSLGRWPSQIPPGPESSKLSWHSTLIYYGDNFLTFLSEGLSLFGSDRKPIAFSYEKLLTKTQETWTKGKTLLFPQWLSV